MNWCVPRIDTAEEMIHKLENGCEENPGTEVKRSKKGQDGDTQVWHVQNHGQHQAPHPQLGWPLLSKQRWQCFYPRYPHSTSKTKTLESNYHAREQIHLTREKGLNCSLCDRLKLPIALTDTLKDTRGGSAQHRDSAQQARCHQEHPARNVGTGEQAGKAGLSSLCPLRPRLCSSQR